MSFRTRRTQAKYDAYQRTVTASTPCFLCLKADVAYEHWKLVKNAFPYDLVVKPDTHFLFCPKRHVAEEHDLTEREWLERDTLVRYDLSKAFSCIALNFARARTHTSHLHYHVWVNKDVQSRLPGMSRLLRLWYRWRRYSP
jgi:diadenosine tetraphosphate (Ap4A) HIT family hydrolase